jgi:hypothetical protein
MQDDTPEEVFSDALVADPLVSTVVHAALPGGKLFLDGNTLRLIEFYAKNHGRVLSRNMMEEILSVCLSSVALIR